MPRWALVSLVLVALAATPAADAAEQRLSVVAVPGLGLDEAAGLVDGAAVGLLVPDAGPETSETRALAALVRGRVRNSLRGGLPEGPVLIELSPEDELRDADIVVGVPDGARGRNDRRYLVVVRAPGFDGLLTSESTRIPGLVSIVDVAPTALGRADGLGSRAAADPLAELRELDRRIDENGDARLPAGAAVVVVALAAAFVHRRAGALAFATAAAANVLLGAAGLSSPWVTVPAIALAAAAPVPLALAVRSAVATAAVFAGVLIAYLVAMALEPAWVALSPLGPTQNARFFGLSNVLATMLLVPALAAAGLFWRRLGPLAFAGVGVLALVTVGGSRFGADGGGAVVLAAGFAVLAAALAGGGRRAWLVGGAGAVVALALVAVDALVGPSTHVGRSLRGGPGEVAGDLGNRLALSFGRATDDWATGLAVLVSIVLLAVLVARGPRHPLPLAFAAAIAVSLLVNDSPAEVAVGGLVGYVTLACFERGARGYNPSR